jgi:hypothetical protein
MLPVILQGSLRKETGDDGSRLFWIQGVAGNVPQH